MILLLSEFACHMDVDSIKQFCRSPGSPVGLLAEAAAAGSAAAADAWFSPIVLLKGALCLSL